MEQKFAKLVLMVTGVSNDLGKLKNEVDVIKRTGAIKINSLDSDLSSMSDSIESSASSSLFE
jgi:hypothetical protein